jgi:hypothetical protein
VGGCIALPTQRAAPCTAARRPDTRCVPRRPASLGPS